MQTSFYTIKKCEHLSYTNSKFLNFINLKLKDAPAVNEKTGSGPIVSVAPYIYGSEFAPILKRLDSDLFQWINEQKDDAKKFFVKPIKNFILDRVWFNKMKNGSTVKVHSHVGLSPKCDELGLKFQDDMINESDETSGENRVVAIFYFYAEPGSGDLVFINQTLPLDSQGKYEVTDFEESLLYRIPISSGDLILHRGDLLHGVSKYIGVEPRICLVLEYKVVFEI